MNSESNVLELTPPGNACDSDPSVQESTDPVHPAFGAGKRGNGFVARLPKAIRDQINNLIRDGVSYPEIIQRVGEPAKHLQPSHIKEWKKRGYQDWLLEQEWLDRLSSKAEFSTDVLAAPNTSHLHEAGLRIAASQMFDQLMRFNAAAETGASDQSEKFARLVNALSRLNREALAFQKYRDTQAKNIPDLKQRDPDRDLADNELLVLVNKFDQTFKMPRPNLDQLIAQAALKKHQSNQVGLVREAELRPPCEPSAGVALAEPTKPCTFAEEGTPKAPSVSVSDSASPQITNQYSKIENPPEYCPECNSLLPPRLPSGERYSIHCQKYGCGSPVRRRGAPFEPCPHCGVTIPDLLPNGQRAAPNCPECKKPLPPPDQVPLLADYLASITTAAT